MSTASSTVFSGSTLLPPSSRMTTRIVDRSSRGPPVAAFRLKPEDRRLERSLLHRLRPLT
jgi:hypothetical protein